MAQGDYLIQNQSFPSFRSDLNSTLEAINTSNSGTSRPSSAVAGTIWLDTTNATTPTLKLYDGTDDISLATFDYSANTVNWLDSTVSADLVNDLSPQLGGMLDVNGNAIGNGTEELIKFSETASAVNEVTVTNSATGNAPEISATGNDTNIDFKLTPKGTGKLILDGLNFPTADGTTGQFLKTDGSGNLSFDNAGGGITMADQWRLSADKANIDTPATVFDSNLERVDTSGQGTIGSAMSESSGIFTFPSTGIYWVSAFASFQKAADRRYCGLNILVTTNNSSYSDIATSWGHIKLTESDDTYTNVAINSYIDVTDTANVKVKFSADTVSGNAITAIGRTNSNTTAFTFIRLGDT